MSKFRIYRSNYYDAKLAGKRNRWMYAVCVLLLFFLSQLPNYSRLINDPKTRLIITLPISILIICFVIILLFRLKLMTSSLKNIGTLEINKSNLKKQIGDLTTTYDYKNICRIELENYFKNVSISKPNSLTRSLKITNNNLIEEVLIISNKSIDYNEKICISDSLQALKKLTDINIEIKNN